MAGRLLIAGCGRLGNLLGAGWCSAGGSAWGIRRDTDRLADGINPVQWAMVDEPAPSLPEVDWLVYAASPAERSIEAYRKTYIDGPAAVLAALPTSPGGVILVSSTAVYGQNQGQLLDETAITEPRRFNGQLLLEAEQAVQGSAETVVIARCSGLYGPEPGRLVKKLRSGDPGSDSGGLTYSNRIHRQDAARALLWIMQQDRPEALYLLTDPKPTPRKRVYQWLAAELGLPDSTATAMDSSQAVSGKQLHPARLLGGGFEFLYPDFRAGYRAILSSPSSAI